MCSSDLVYWREQAKAGAEVRASIIHTTSTSGLFANPGQANYDAAKSGIATFSQVCAKELGRYGVRSNAIAPGARTRLTEATPGLGDAIKPPTEGFDTWNPGNVSPFVAYLATADCPITGECFMVQGGTVQRTPSWSRAEKIEKDKVAQQASHFAAQVRAHRRQLGGGHHGRRGQCFAVLLGQVQGGLGVFPGQ